MRGSGASRGERGFTLAEILAASLVLALALISLSSLIGIGLRNNAVAREESVLTALAQAKLEQLRGLPRGTLEQLLPGECRGVCVVNCVCGPGCDTVRCCPHPCYPRGCAPAAHVGTGHEDPVPDPNRQDDVREDLFVRAWEVRRVNLGSPVGCVWRITVTAGSRSGLLAPPPPGHGSWADVPWQDVVGPRNPRRVALATYR